MKNTALLSFLFVAFLALTFVSCSTENTELEELKVAEDYFPLTIGNFIEYRLDSTIYKDFDNSVTTNSYKVKNEITKTLVDNKGETIYEVRRYIKPFDSTDDYEFEYNHYLKEEGGNLVAIENQLRYTKLVSPIILDKTWEGNKFITTTQGGNPTNATFYLEDWDYTYKEINGSLVLGNTPIENVVHVNQVDKFGGPGAINHFVSDEYYAKGIGLVKQRREILVENCGAVNCSEKELPILERTKGRKGFIVDLEMINFSVN